MMVSSTNLSSKRLCFNTFNTLKVHRFQADGFKLRTKLRPYSAGSLTKASLRLAAYTGDGDKTNDVREYDEKFEIVSLTGTLSQAGRRAPPLPATGS